VQTPVGSLGAGCCRVSWARPGDPRIVRGAFCRRVSGLTLKPPMFGDSYRSVEILVSNSAGCRHGIAHDAVVVAMCENGSIRGWTLYTRWSASLNAPVPGALEAVRHESAPDLGVLARDADSLRPWRTRRSRLELKYRSQPGVAPPPRSRIGQVLEYRLVAQLAVAVARRRWFFPAMIW